MIKNNVFKISNILEKDFCNFIYNYAIIDEIYFKSRASTDLFKKIFTDNQGLEWMLSDIVNKRTFAKYADPVTETLLLMLQPKIENVVGENLIPTYSYYRNYRPGYELLPHVDRTACEISVSIFIGCDYNRDYYSWDLGVETEKGIFSVIDLDISDCIVYNGPDIPHGRPRFEPPEGSNHVQAFLHYVKANGLYANEKYDKREYLGFPSPMSGR
jgi:hypothetical protein